MGFGSLALRNGDDLAEGPWDDPFGLFRLIASHYCMRFAAARLPVGKDGAIVSIEYAVDEGECTLLVDQTLSRIGCEYKIEGEALGLFLIILSN